MVKVIPQPKPELPDPGTGMVWTAFPLREHFLSDPSYWDAFGRDPLAQHGIWKVTDPLERIERLNELLPRYPPREHRRRMMRRLAEKGEDELLRILIQTGTPAHPHEDEANEPPEPENHDLDHPDPDREVNMGCTPLQTAANHGHLTCVKILIEEAEVPVDARDVTGRTALIVAAGAGSGSVEMVEYLLSKGANPAAAPDPDNAAKEYIGEWAAADALALGALLANMEIVRLLLDRQEDDEDRIPNITALHIKAAARSHGPESGNILKLFLSRAGYPLESTPNTSKASFLTPEQHETIVTATEEAAVSGKLDCLQWLLSYIYPSDASGKLAPFELPTWLHDSFVSGVYRACVQGQLEKFCWLTSFNIAEWPTCSLNDLHGEKLNYSRMLGTAAEHGHVKMIQMLVEQYGVDPIHIRIPTGMTALWLAAVADQLEAVRYLLSIERVRDVGIHLGHGRWMLGPTPLSTAIQVHSNTTVIELLKHGGPVDEVDEDIKTGAKPITAVLLSSMKHTAPVRLLTKSNAEKYENDPATRFMLLEIDEYDEKWLNKIVSRKGEEELRQFEPLAPSRPAHEGMEEDEPPEWAKYCTSWPTLEYRERALEWDYNSI